MSIAGLWDGILSIFKLIFDMVSFLIEGVVSLASLLGSGLPLITSIVPYIPPVAQYAILGLLAFAVIKLVLDILPG